MAKQKKKLSNSEILDLEMGTNDANADTIGDYLRTLLGKLWREREGFSGKRPFGCGGWEFDLYEPLIRAGQIDGSFDEDNCIKECDDEAGDAIIADAIGSLS